MTNLALSYTDDSSYFDIPGYNNEIPFNTSIGSLHNESFFNANGMMNNIPIDIMYDGYDELLARAYDTALLADDNNLNDLFLCTTPPPSTPNTSRMLLSPITTIPWKEDVFTMPCKTFQQQQQQQHLPTQTPTIRNIRTSSFTFKSFNTVTSPDFLFGNAEIFDFDPEPFKGGEEHVIINEEISPNKAFSSPSSSSMKNNNVIDMSDLVPSSPTRHLIDDYVIMKSLCNNDKSTPLLAPPPAAANDDKDPFDISKLLIPFENDYHGSLSNLKSQQDMLSLQLDLNNYLSSPSTSTCDIPSSKCWGAEFNSINSLSSSFKNSMDLTDDCEQLFSGLVGLVTRPISPDEDSITDYQDCYNNQNNNNNIHCCTNNAIESSSTTTSSSYMSFVEQPQSRLSPTPSTFMSGCEIETSLPYAMRRGYKNVEQTALNVRPQQNSGKTSNKSKQKNKDSSSSSSINNSKSKQQKAPTDSLTGKKNFNNGNNKSSNKINSNNHEQHLVNTTTTTTTSSPSSSFYNNNNNGTKSKGNSNRNKINSTLAVNGSSNSHYHHNHKVDTNVIINNTRHLNNDHNYCYSPSSQLNCNSIVVGDRDEDKSTLHKISPNNHHHHHPINPIIPIGQRFKNNIHNLAKSIRNQMVPPTTCQLSKSSNSVSLLQLSKRGGSSCLHSITTNNHDTSTPPLNNEKNIVSFLLSSAKNKINELKANNTHNKNGNFPNNNNNLSNNKPCGIATNRKRQISTNSITYDLASTLGNSKKFAPQNWFPSFNNKSNSGNNRDDEIMNMEEDSIITTITDKLGNVFVINDNSSPPSPTITAQDTTTDNSENAKDVREEENINLTASQISQVLNNSIDLPIHNNSKFGTPKKDLNSCNPLANESFGSLGTNINGLLVDGGLYLDNQFLAYLDDESPLSESTLDLRVNITEGQGNLIQDLKFESKIDKDKTRPVIGKTLAESLESELPKLGKVEVATVKCTKSNSLPSNNIFAVTNKYNSEFCPSGVKKKDSNTATTTTSDGIRSSCDSSLVSKALKKNLSFTSALGEGDWIGSKSCKKKVFDKKLTITSTATTPSTTTKSSPFNTLTQTAKGLFSKSLWNDFTLTELKFNGNTSSSSSPPPLANIATNKEAKESIEKSNPANNQKNSTNKQPIVPTGKEALTTIKNQTNNNNKSNNSIKQGKKEPEFKIDEDKTVKISPIPNDITSNELRKMFKKFGDIRALKIVDGTAYLTYTNTRDALTAIRRGNHISGIKFNVSTTKTPFLFENEDDGVRSFNLKDSTSSNHLTKPSLPDTPSTLSSITTNSNNSNPITATVVEEHNSTSDDRWLRRRRQNNSNLLFNNFLKGTTTRSGHNHQHILQKSVAAAPSCPSSAISTASNKSNNYNNVMSNKNYQQSLRLGTPPDYKSNGYRNAATHKIPPKKRH